MLIGFCEPIDVMVGEQREGEEEEGWEGYSEISTTKQASLFPELGFAR